MVKSKRKENTKSIQPLTPPQKKDTDFDVYLGRGDGVAGRLGNRLYRKIIKAHKRQYRTTRGNKAKTQLANDIVNAFYSKGGTVYCREGQDGKWKEASLERILSKVKQALREPDRKGIGVLTYKEDPIIGINTNNYNSAANKNHIGLGKSFARNNSLETNADVLEKVEEQALEQEQQEERGVVQQEAQRSFTPSAVENTSLNCNLLLYGAPRFMGCPSAGSSSTIMSSTNSTGSNNGNSAFLCNYDTHNFVGPVVGSFILPLRSLSSNFAHHHNSSHLLRPNGIESLAKNKGALLEQQERWRRVVQEAQPDLSSITSNSTITKRNSTKL